MANGKTIKPSEYRTLKMVNGQYRTVKLNNVIGYCHSPLHRGFVTKSQYAQHKCAEKNCKKFRKFKDRDFWKECEAGEKKKQEKKEQKKASKAQKKKEAQLERNKLEKIKQRAQSIFDNLGCVIMLTSVQKRGDDYVIYYVSDEGFNDEFKYRFICTLLSEEYEENLQVRHIKDGDVYLTTTQFKINKKKYK